MSETWYRLQFDNIEAFTVVAETPKTVTYLSRWDSKPVREAKGSDWRTWHRTFEEAQAEGVRRLERRVQSAKDQLDECQGKLDRIKAATRPEVQPPRSDPKVTEL